MILLLQTKSITEVVSRVMMVVAFEYHAFHRLFVDTTSVACRFWVAFEEG